MKIDKIDIGFLIGIGIIVIGWGLYLLINFIHIAHNENRLYQESDANQEVK